VVDELDVEFAVFMATLAGQSGRDLLLGCALASHAVAEGDVCLALEQYAGQLLLRPLEGHKAIFAPEQERWSNALRRSRVVGEPGEFKPLILDARDRLYLYRYWYYEDSLAAELRRRAVSHCPVDAARLQAGLQRLFPATDGKPVDWQKVAAALAVLRPFSVISGGPGTGKTTTLAKILVLLLEQATQPLRIRLAAPTGKAAARMQEALRHSKAQLADQVMAEILAALPEDAATLHRLLGPRPDGVYFQHDQDNPLPLDVLVIDEASMVDLALLAKTVWALPTAARLILLGDKDQLSSVEAGAVLGDICAEAGRYSPAVAAQLTALTGTAVLAGTEEPRPLQDAVALLRHSYRFGSDSGIGRLANAVNQADEKVLRKLHRQPPADVCWHAVPGEEAEAALLALIREGYRPYLEQVRAGAEPAAVFAAFQQYRVLCPQRRGPGGVEPLNGWLENGCRQQWGRVGSEWYPGRPVMVTRNDYPLRLFNGDIGIALSDPAQPERLRVYFQQADGGMRSFPVTRLPDYEPVYVMTIHKSQGSEFDQVLLVLPGEDSRLLTRELIYTAVTRARRQVAIWGEPQRLIEAARKSVQRSSGLREKLGAVE
jgi:exodeoxyribonuclease V alpha subunit